MRKGNLIPKANYKRTVNIRPKTCFKKCFAEIIPKKKKTRKRFQK